MTVVALVVAGIGAGVLVVRRPSLPKSPSLGAEDRLASGAVLELGLGPDRLTAAGVSPQVLGAAVGDAVAAASTHGQAIDAARAGLAAALAEVARFRRASRSGVADAAQSLVRAQERLAVARTQYSAAIAPVRDAALARLTEQQRATLARLQTAPSRRGATLAFAAAARGEFQETQLRDALTERRVQASVGREASSDQRAAIAEADSDSGVASAKAALDAHLAEARSAWRSSLFDGP